MGRTKKSHLNFYLENDIIKRMDIIVGDADNIFDDRSKIIRFCVKQQLPLIEKQIQEEKQ